MRLVLATDPTLPPTLAALIDMLRYARQTTLDAVHGLTVAQLDHRHDAQSNSIGALLLHVAAVEAYYQVNSFDQREWNESDEQTWLGALELASEIARDKPLEFYVDRLASVRERTERELRERDEEWLLRVEPFDGTPANNYWKWFHVCEDEINHRGQIRWLRKRLP